MNQRREDLNWLYRQEPELEATKVMPTFDSAEAPQPQPTPPQPGPQGPPGYGPPPTGYGQPTQPAYPQPGFGAPPPPPPQPPKTKKKRHPVRRMIIALLVAWLAFMIGTPIFAWNRVTQVAATPAGSRLADQPGTTILLAGTDTFDPREPRKKATRTDTMMLLHMPTTGQPALISLPRDSYLPIPGHGKNKLNAAFAFGGAPLLVQTVEAATGVRIDGFFLIGYTGLTDMVDAVGGIEVCLKKAVKDRFSQLDLPAGCHHINGKTALSYVRMRQADPKGDLGRVERQREVIAKVTKKAMQPQHLLNPVTYWRMNMAVSGSLSKGNDTGLGEAIALARGFLGVSSGSGHTLTVPIANANASTPAGSSVLWDDAKAKKLFSLIAAGNTTGMEEFVR